MYSVDRDALRLGIAVQAETKATDLVARRCVR